jgi:hypothetical protein
MHFPPFYNRLKYFKSIKVFNGMIYKRFHKWHQKVSTSFERENALRPSSNPESAIPQHVLDRLESEWRQMQAAPQPKQQPNQQKDPAASSR